MLDKDAFVQENWPYLSELGREIASMVHCKFTSVEYEDLYGYAIQGVLEAFTNIDLKHKSWIIYLRQCCYHYTLNGVMKMLGLTRTRTKKGVRYVCAQLQFFDHNSLVRIADAKSTDPLLDDLDMLFDIILNCEIDFIRKCLGNSLEGQVFEYIINNKDIYTAACKLELSRYTIKLMIKHIVSIYELARENLPYQHLLTPPKNIPD